MYPAEARKKGIVRLLGPYAEIIYGKLFEKAVERIYASENYNDLPTNLKRKLLAIYYSLATKIRPQFLLTLTLTFCRRRSIKSSISANKIYCFKEASDQHATCPDVTISANVFSVGLSSSWPIIEYQWTHLL